MRITAESRIRAYCEQYPDAAAALGAFLTVARAARWRNIQELRLTYPPGYKGDPDREVERRPGTD